MTKCVRRLRSHKGDRCAWFQDGMCDRADKPVPCMEIEETTARKEEKSKSPPQVPRKEVEQEVCESIPDNLEDYVESFKALGVEVCFATSFGDVWLVPQLTRKQRHEITPEMVAKIHTALRIFPGAKITDIEELRRKGR